MTRFLIILISLCLTQTAGAATRYVWTNSPGTNNNDYLTWETAATNIPEAVSVAQPDDVVLVTNGVYYASTCYTSGTFRAMVVVRTNITIQSVNGPAVTIVDGNYPAWTNRCFFITNANAMTLVVSGFTITNGHASDVNKGGGVYIGGFGTLTNCWITGNVATDTVGSSQGGGVYCIGGGPVVKCQIYGNTATNGGGGVGAAGTFIGNCDINSNRGGGVYIYTGCTMDNCRITGNVNDTGTRGDGGGIMMNAARVINCVIYSNVVIGAITDYKEGGGVRMIGASVLSNCVVSANSNSGAAGGGIYMTAGGTVVDCTIVSNWCSGGGGGAGGESGSIRNCLIANNVTLGSGGGLWYGTVVENCTIVSNRASGTYGGGGGGIMGGGLVCNTILYSNQSATANPNWSTNIANSTFSNCCTTPTNPASGQVLPGTGNITNWPKFMDFAADNYRLTNGSPCINTGTNQDWMTGATDLDGHSRLDGFTGLADIGAYEYLPKGTVVSIR